MIQARLGSAEACRAAQAKLAAEDELIAQADKNIAKTRGEFESRDRTLTESSRTQEEEVKLARQQHQSVRRKKIRPTSISGAISRRRESRHRMRRTSSTT